MVLKNFNIYWDTFRKIYFKVETICQQYFGHFSMYFNTTTMQYWMNNFLNKKTKTKIALWNKK